MSSFYEKLSMKFQGEAAGTAKDAAPAGKSVTYSATGNKVPPKPDVAPGSPPPAGTAAAPAAEIAPEGTDPIDIDLFQSDTRMVVFMQIAGVPADGFSVTASEESNTLVIEATQKRPALPKAPGTKDGDPPEKGIYTKSEIKWKSLYRKVYLPATFDGSEVEVTLDKGVLVITLPAKHPGAGRKLTVREVAPQDEKKK